jgi:hypothetical protein
VTGGGVLSGAESEEEEKVAKLKQRLLSSYPRPPLIVIAERRHCVAQLLSAAKLALQLRIAEVIITAERRYCVAHLLSAAKLALQLRIIIAAERF